MKARSATERRGPAVTIHRSSGRQTASAERSATIPLAPKTASRTSTRVRKNPAGHHSAKTPALADSSIVPTCRKPRTRADVSLPATVDDGSGPKAVGQNQGKIKSVIGKAEPLTRADGAKIDDRMKQNVWCRAPSNLGSRSP